MNPNDLRDRMVGSDVLPNSSDIAPANLVSPTAGMEAEAHRPIDDLVELNATTNVMPDDTGPVSLRSRLSLGRLTPLGWVVIILIFLTGTGLVMGSLTRKPSNKSTGQSANLSGIAGPITADNQQQSLQIHFDTLIRGKQLTTTGAVLIQNEQSDGLQVQGAGGSDLLVADTSGNKVGIGGKPTGTAKLQVNGDLSVSGRIVSASGYSLSSQGLSLGGVLVCTAAGCTNQTIDLSPFARLAGSNNFSGINKFTAAGNTFAGDGSGLSALNAGNVSSGTLSDSRLSSNVALRNANNTFTGNNSFTSLLQAGGGLNASNYSVGGTSGANIACAANEALANGVVSSGIITGGSCIALAGATTPTLQDVYDASNPATIILSSNGAVQVQDAATPLGTDLFVVANNGGATKYFAVSAAGISITGNVNTTGQYSVNGSQISSSNLSDGSNLAKLNGAQTFTGANTFNNAGNSFNGNGSGLTSLDASNISSGTLNDLRLSNNVTQVGNTFNGANQLVQLTAGGILPILNGSNLTSLNAGSISTGTLSDARLSANVALLDADNIFLGDNSYHLKTKALTVQDAASPLGTNLFEVTDNTGTTKYFTVSATALQFNGNDVCTAAGNCTGVSGGAIGGSGTAGKLAKFTGSGFTVGDSLLSESGTTLTASGNINITAGNQYQINGSQISSAALSNDSNLAKLNGTQTFTGANTFNNASNSFTGDGSGLSNVNAAQLNGQAGSYYTNATNISTGTLGDGRLSSNVALLDRTGQTFSGTNTFSNSITAPGITAGGAALGIGASTDTLNLNGTYSSKLSVTDGTHTTTLGFNGVPTANVTYNFDVTAAAGTYTICTTAGNCSGVGGAVTTSSDGTNGTIAMFTGTQSIANSILTQSGTTVTVGGTLDATTLTQGGSGVLLQTTSFSGDVSGAYNSLSVDKLKGTSLSITALADTNFLIYNSGTGNWENHSISGDISVTNSGVAAIGTGKVTTTQIADGTISNIDISGTAGIAYSKLNLSNSITNSDISGTAAISDSKLAQITSANKVADSALSSNVALLDRTGQTFSGTNTFSNSITAPEITAGGAALGIGASGDTLNLNGTYSSSLAATDGTHTTTIGFTGIPTANVTYDFDVTAAAGTYNICTTAGNCTGVSGGSIGGSGTANKLAKFTGSGFTIGDSILTDNGSTVSVAGTLNATTLQQGGTGVLLQTTAFSGDVTGTYNSLSLAKIAGTTLTVGTLTSGQFLQYNGTAWVNQTISGDITVDSTGASTIGVGKVTSSNIADGTITNIDISGTAAIGYSKLNLSGSIINSDISSTAAIDYSKLNLAGSIINSDISGSAAIAYSKLNLGSSIVSGDLSATLASSLAFLANNQTFTGLNTIKNNDVAGFQVQNSTSSKAVMTVDTSGNQLVLGAPGPSGVDGKIVFNNSAGVNSVGLALSANPSSSYTLLLPTTNPGTGQCLQTDATTANQLVFGNCAGSGSGVTTVGVYNSANHYANGAQISGSTITLGGADATNPGLIDTSNQTFAGTKTFNNSIVAPGITAGGAALGIGASTDTLNLNGTYSSSLAVTDGTHTTTVGFAGTPTANVTYDFDVAAAAGSYTICTTAGNCTGTGGGVTASSNGTNGTIAMFTGAQTIANSIITQSGTTVSVGGTLDATTLTQGGTGVLLQTTSFSGDVTGTYNSLSLAKIAGTTLTVATLASGQFLQYNGTAWVNHSISGDITIDNTGAASIGVGKVTSSNIADGTITNIDISGTAAIADTKLAQITSANKVADSALSSNVALLDRTGQTFSGTNTFSNSITAPAITAGGAALGIGASTDTLNLNGTYSSKLAVTDGTHTTTVGFSGVPTANITYNFDVAAATGTYTICTTAGNCTGVGGGVTTSSNGTNGTIAMFTGAQTIANSIITQSGTTVSVGGTLDATTLTQGGTGVLLQSTAFSGDVSGSYNSLSLDKIAGTTLTVATLTSGQFLQYNGTAWVNQTISGDITINSSGVAAIGTGKVTTTQIADGTISNIDISGSAAISDAKLAQITSANKVADSALSTNVALLDRTGQTFSGTNTFSNSITAPGITAGGAALGIGASTDTLNLNGTYSSSLAVTDGTHTTTVGFSGVPTASVTYDFDVTAAAGTYNICTTAGNCSGVGGGVTTSSNGTNGTIAMFTGAQTIANSIITQSGTTVTVGGTLDATTLTQAGTGVLLQTTSFSGDVTGTYNSLSLAKVAGTTLTVSSLASGQFLQYNGTAWVNHSISGDITIDNTGAASIGVGKVTSSNIADGTISNVDISGTAAISDTKLAQITSANKVADSALSSNVALLDRTGQTFSGTNTFSNSITAPGITAGGAALGIGASTDTLNLNGTYSSSLAVTDGTHTTTVGFSGVPTASVTYNFDVTAAAGSYTICTTAGNCTGTGGGVTTSSNGTNGTIAMFTGAQTIANSIITQSGTTVTVAGTLNATTLQQGGTGVLLTSTAFSGDITGSYNSLSLAKIAGTTLSVSSLASGQFLQYDGTNWVNHSISGDITIDNTGASAIGTGKVTSTQIADGTIANIDISGTAGIAYSKLNLGSSIVSGDLSSSLANSLAYLANNQTFTGNNIFAASNATAFQVQSSGAADTLLAVNTLTRSGVQAGNYIKVGNSTALTADDTTILVLDSYAGTVNDLTSLNGGLYYNSSTNHINVIENGQVKELCNKTDLGCGSSAPLTTLAGSYTNGTSQTDSTILLDSTRLGVLIRDKSGGIGSTLFGVQDSTGGTKYLDVTSAGISVLGTSISGSAITFGAASAASIDAASGQNLNLGTGASVHTTTLGSTNSSSTTNVQSGSGGINLVGNVNVNGTNTFTVNGGLTSLGSNVDVTGALSLKHTTDVATTGALNNLPVASSLLRLTGASPQTLTGIALSGGNRDGAMLVVVNAGAGNATISNLNAGSSAANQITTGTNANISLPVGGSITLIYDNQASLWRVIGDVAGGVGTGVTSIGTFTSCTSYANGAQISSNTLTLSCADTSNPGLVSTGAQTWAGAKTFNNLITGNAGISTSGGAFNLQGNANSSLATANVTGGNSANISITTGNITTSGVAGNVTIDTGTTISGTPTINIGGANAKAVAIGNTGASFTAESNATANLFNGNTAHTINIGAGATATNTITIGSANSTSSVLLQGGTGNSVQIQSQGTILIGNNAVAQNITIGNATGATSVAVQCGTASCGFGNNATDHPTAIGSTTGGSQLTLQAGTSGATLQTAAVTSGTSGSVSITTGNGTSTGIAGSVTIDTGTTTSASPSVNIATTNAKIVSIGNTGGSFTAESNGTANLFNGNNSHTVNIAAGAIGANTDIVKLGSTSSASTTTVQGGTGAGAISLQAASGGTILIGSTNANAITLGGNVTASANIDIAGSLATKKGTDYTGVGTQADINFGNASLVRLNPASPLTIAGIAGGRDGYQLRLINASAVTVTVNNNDTTNELTAANLIITGSGSNVNILAGAAIELIYDSGSSVWRVVGSGSATAGGTFLSKNSADTSSAAVTAGNYLYSFTNSSSSVNSGVLSLDNGNNTGTVLNVKGSSSSAFQVQGSSGSALLTGDTISTAVDVTGSLNVGTNYGARLMSDNFEGNNDDLWDPYVSGFHPSIESSVVHSGKYAVEFQPVDPSNADFSYYYGQNGSSANSVYLRTWVYVASQSTSSLDLAEISYNLFNTYWTVQRSSTGQLCIKSVVASGTTAQTCSVATNFTTGAWHEVEFTITSATTSTGSASAWLDGAPSPTVSVSGQNYGSSLAMTTVMIGSPNPGSTGNFYEDDFVAYQDTGRHVTDLSANIDENLHVGGSTTLSGELQIAPAYSSTQAFKISNQDGSIFFNLDTANQALTANSTAIFKNKTNSPTAFQVQNSSGSTLLNVDTSSSTITASSTNINLGSDTAGHNINIGSGPSGFTVLDNFNRANGSVSGSTASGGGTWSSLAMGGSGSNLVVSSNSVTGLTASAYNNNYLTSSYGPDSEAYVTISTVGNAGANEVGALYLRLNNSNNSAETGYELIVLANGTWQFWRVNNSTTFVALGSTFSQAISAGDMFGFRVTGTTTPLLEAWYKSSSGTWTRLSTFTDNFSLTPPGSQTPFNSAGNVGLEVYSTAPRLDDLRAGNAATEVLTVGAPSASSSLSLQSGTGNINLSSAGSVTVKPVVDSTTAFQIQNAAGTSNLLVADTTNSRVGIGTATPTAQLDVTGNAGGISNSVISVNATATSNSIGQSGLNTALTITPSAASTKTYTGTSSFAISTANTSSATIIGLYGESRSQSTNTGSAVGGQFIVDSWAQTANANITNGYGVQVQNAGVLSLGKTATITSAVGVDVDNQTSATNNTNLLLGTTTIPTGNYSIYNSSAYNNYFAGSLGIGTNAPSDTLEVVGNIVSKGTSWTAQTPPASNFWNSVTYGNGRFVAVGQTSTGNRVMTSPDGVNWTIRNSAADNSWTSVTYGNGLFVAVSFDGTNQVMTSPDGITWTSRTAAASNQWDSVTYGNGLFVAVANTGTGNRVMTSPDGVNWTIRSSAADKTWFSVAYGNGTFVAVSGDGAVMTSPDGISWTLRTAAAANNWTSVTYGNGLFVAVAQTGTGNRVMTSPDGVTWTSRSSVADNTWNSVTYGNGLFVAVASTGTSRVMTSPNGINWTARTVPTAAWISATYGNGTFVSVAISAGSSVMTSGREESIPFSANNTFQGGTTVYGNSLFKSDANSATAFQVQNAAGNNFIQVDTSGANLSLGNTGIASTIQVGNTTGAVAQTINIGNNATVGSTTAVNIGSLTTGSPVIIQGDTVKLASNLGVTVQPATDITNAFTVQSAVSVGNKLNFDTSNGQLSVQNVGALGSWTQSPNSLLTVRPEAAVTSSGTYMYVLGGDTSTVDSTPVTNVYYAALKADGSTGAWQSNSTSLPGPIRRAGATVYNGYVYVVGGRNGTDGAGTTVNTIYYAPINTDGSLGSWSTNVSTIPGAIMDARPVVYKGFIYVVGGKDTNFNLQSSVYYAPINANGSIGTWVTSGSSLPQVRSGYVTAIGSNGYIYEEGGAVSGVVGGSNTNYHALINGDGSIGAWSSDTFLPAARTPYVVSYGNSIYALGGSDTSFSSTTTSWYAALNSGGTTSSWLTASNNLPATNLIGAVSSSYGYIYMISSQNTSVYSATLNPVLSVKGPTLLKATSDTNTAFQVQNASGVNVLAVNTANQQVSIGSVGTATGQLYVSGTKPSSALATVGGIFDNPESIAIRGDFAFVGSAGSLYSYDISNPSSPSLLTQAGGFGIDDRHVVAQNRYVYMADPSDEFSYIADAQDPYQISFSASGNVDFKTSSANSVAVQGRYVYYVTSDNKLKIFDTINPEYPNQISSVATGTNPVDIKVIGTYAYVINQGSNSLQVFDVKDPKNPTLYDTMTTGAGPVALEVNANYAYVLNGGATKTLQIFNIDNSALQGSVAVGNGPTSVAVSGNRAYVTNSTDNTLQIIDVANAAQPTSIGTVATGQSPQQVAIKGRYAYVVNYTDNNLQVFDLGGAYIQQLEAGALQATDVNANTIRITGDAKFEGGLQVGNSLQVAGDIVSTGNLFVQGETSFGSAIKGGVTIAALASPSAPTVTSVGTTGTSTYKYAVSAVGPAGSETLVSPDGQTVTGNATLSGTNGSDITWPAVDGAVSYKVYRTFSNGTPSTTGYLGTAYTTEYYDGGLAASGATPTANSTGGLTVNGNGLFKSVTNNTAAFQVQNASGGSLINVDSQNSNITLNGLNAGELNGWNTSGNSLPSPDDANQAVAANGYLYVTGGENSGTATNNVYYAKLNADGSTGAWQTESNILPAARRSHSTVVTNGYIYVIAGTDVGSTARNTVYFARLNPDGTTGVWQTNPRTLPVNRKNAGAVAVNGYIYVMGGDSEFGNAQGGTYYAKVNADGTTGPWQTITVGGFPAREYLQSSTLTANGYIYILGGGDSSGVPQTTVYYNGINSDGSVGTWQATTALPVGLARASAIAANGYIYVIGGVDSSGNSVAPVYYAKMNSDGTLGAWTTSNKPLTSARSLSGVTKANGYIYILGGMDGSGTSSAVVRYTSTSRIQLGGSIDLVGLAAGNLTSNSSAGAITAGNGTFVGNLLVQGDANLSQSLSLGGNLNVSGSVALQNSVDSATAFQVQNASSVSIVNVSTISSNQNLLTNASFESGTTGWAALNGATLSTVTTPVYAGSQSLQAVLNAANASDGVKYQYYFAPNTTYTLSVYAAITSGTTSTFEMGTVQNGGAQTSCGVTGVTLTGSLTRYTCTFTTGATTTGSDYLYLKRTTAAAGTLVFDAAQLEIGSSSTTFTDVPNPNLVANPNLENNTNGWSVHGTGTGASIASSTDFAKFGNASLKIVTGTVASNGAQFNVSLQASTRYSLSFWARKDTGSAAFTAGYNPNPPSLGSATNDTACTTTPDITAAGAVTTTWTQFTCTFTTGATVNALSNIFIKQTDTVSDNLYIDGVTLVASGTSQSYVQPAVSLQADPLYGNLSLNSSNIGEIQPWVTSPNALPSARWATSPVYASNGYIYVVGGFNSSNVYQSSVFYTKVNADGSVGSWTTSANSLPVPLMVSGITTSNGYMYVVGGETTGTIYTNYVFYVKLNADGSTGVWQTGTYLPAPREADGAIVANGYLYAIGGSPAAANGSNTAYYAKINTDGSIGAWQSTSTLPATRYHMTLATGNGYVYVVGSDTNGSSSTNVVYYAKMNKDGTLNSWSTNAISMPFKVRGARSAILNGYLYVIGGRDDNNNYLNSVFYAKLNADGSTGSWTISDNPLPIVEGFGYTAPVANGYIYAIGGVSGSTVLSSVYYTSTSRISVGGSLDLVGGTGQTLADGSTGGSLTAGNTQVVGSLSVQEQATFGSSIYATGNIIAGGSLGVSGGASIQGPTVINGGKNQMGAPTSLAAVAAAGGALTAGNYLYEVTAQDAYGNETTVSNEATGTTATTNLTINLSWNAVSGASSYRVYRTAINGASGTETLLTSVTTNSFSDAGSLTPNSVTPPATNTTGQLTVQGSALFKNTTNSTMALQVQNSGGTNLLSADTVNLKVSIGSSTTDATAVSLVLDSYNNGTDPAGTNGAMYYNTSLNKFRCYENGTWTNCVSTLQSAYDASSSSPQITLDNSPGAGGLVIQDNSTPLVGSLFTVQSNGGGTKYLDVTSSRVTTTDLSVGTLGTLTGQLYVSGKVPTTYISSSTASISGPNRLFVLGRYAYITNATTHSLVIEDVSNPASPSVISTTTTPFAGPQDVYVQGRYAYIDDITNNALYIFDISNPASPTQVGSTTAGLNAPQGVYVQGRYAFMASSGNNSMVVFDVSNPAAPREVSSISTNLSTPVRVYVQGTYAYVSNQGSNGVSIFNVSNPVNPSAVTTFSTNLSNPRYTIVQGRYAYVASTGNNSLVIYDISNPATPVQTGILTDNTNLIAPTRLAVQGRYVYIAGRDSGTLVAVDVSNPASPVEVGVITAGLMSGSNNGARGMFVSGRYLYVTGAGNSVFNIYDMGGTYTQQLEAGGAEFGSLGVDGNALFSGDASIQGGLSTGSLQTTGDIGAAGGLNVQGGTVLGGGINQVGVPGAPTVTPQGTAGSQQWRYTITAVNAYGGETTASAEGSTVTGNATLDSTNFNRITWSAVTNAVSYKIYRTYTTGATSPTTTGLIATTTALTFDDTGITATSAAPTINTTGQLTVQGSSLFQNITDSTSAFQIQDASGSNQMFVVDTVNKKIGIGGAPTTSSYILTINGGEFITGSLALGQPSCTSKFCITTGNVGATISETGSNDILQLQNSGVNVMNLSSTGVLTLAGTTTTFANLTLTNSHFKSTQTNAPTIGMTTCVGSPALNGTGATGATDSAGSFTTGSLTTGGSCVITVTFNKAYSNAPKSVIITPKNGTAAGMNAYVSGTTSTTFVVTFTGAATTSNSYDFYYWVVE